MGMVNTFSLTFMMKNEDKRKKGWIWTMERYDYLRGQEVKKGCMNQRSNDCVWEVHSCTGRKWGCDKCLESFEDVKTSFSQSRIKEKLNILWGEKEEKGIKWDKVFPQSAFC